VSYQRILVLGGARSGKSAFAERLAAETGASIVYVATATAGDQEMVERIAHHKAQRPQTWRTLEIPVGIAAGVAAALQERGGGVTVIVEDLTFLLSNLMADDVSGDEAARLAEGHAIEEVRGLLVLPADVILVSNEVGMGLVPPYPLGRRFRDALGRVNQFAAAECRAVHLLVAGLPLQLK
jgi:adenosylcobinamide kinase / adenosylcobinamide-phosphate guanylyltransferase